MLINFFILVPSVAEPVHFWTAPASSIFFTGSGTCSNIKEGFQPQNFFFQLFFLTGKMSFIYKYSFLFLK